MEDRLLTLKLEDFEPLLEQDFTFHVPSGPTFPTKLAHVRPLGGQTVPEAQRKPFAVIFTTEIKGVLPQQIVNVENATLGTLEIFVVPVGPDPKGRMQYEAVFT